MKSTFGSHSRRIAVLLLNVLFSCRFVLRFIGWLNRRGHFIASVFVAYPATEDYALAYVYPRHRHWMHWTPWLVGLLYQDGRWGLMFVISATEADFSAAGSLLNLRHLVARTDELRQVLGATHMSFAGVLPGILFSRRIIRDSPEADTTVEAIFLAEEHVRTREGYDASVPLIILGGHGFIGRRLVRRLAGRQIHSVDPASTCNGSWPHHLRGTRAVLINVSRRATLHGYFAHLWPSLIIINEVYPEPSATEIAALTDIGSTLYHVFGIAGEAYPHFPSIYAAAIPCCAARLTDNMQAVVHRLN